MMTDGYVGSFAGLFYLSLWVAAKLHMWDSKGETWKVFVVIIPSIGAGLIAASRIMDARHHPFDVITGSLLGILCAWISYRQYFGPVTEAWRKGRAYPIRSWGRSNPPTEAPSVAYEGVHGEAGDAQASQRRANLPRHEFSESQAELTRHAEAMDTSALAARANARREDEWESSENEDDFELQTAYIRPAASEGYVPRAHLATTTQHV